MLLDHRYKETTCGFSDGGANGCALGVHRTHIERDCAGNQAPKTSTYLRRDSRYATSIRALLYKGDSFQSTTIRDVSAGGAGLRGAIGVMAGDKVTLQLLDGRQLDAVVRWWLASCCGLAFSQPLDPDDRLLVRHGERALKSER
jgi:PilZ domain